MVCCEDQLLMVEQVDEAMDVDSHQQPMELPISIDTLYNLIICTHCNVGLLLEWVPSHLQEQHGIHTISSYVSQYLSDRGMTVTEVNDWRDTVWVDKAVQNIPIIQGYRCNLCEYSVAKKKGMKNHFAEQHKWFKRRQHSEKCKVQLVFHRSIRKYIQVKEDDEDIDVNEREDVGWKKAIDMEFNESMANLEISEINVRDNLRLKNVFIAKTRWDAMVEGLDYREIVTLIELPIVNDELHKIVICGRRYIHRTCEALDKGSVIVKRLLMLGRCLNFLSIANYVGKKK